MCKIVCTAIHPRAFFWWRLLLSDQQNFSNVIAGGTLGYAGECGSILSVDTRCLADKVILTCNRFGCVGIMNRPKALPPEGWVSRLSILIISMPSETPWHQHSSAVQYMEPWQVVWRHSVESPSRIRSLKIKRKTEKLDVIRGYGRSKPWRTEGNTNLRPIQISTYHK